MKQEPPPDTKCRDKFLVQSVSITGDKEFSNLAAIVSKAIFRPERPGLTRRAVGLD